MLRAGILLSCSGSGFFRNLFPWRLPCGVSVETSLRSARETSVRSACGDFLEECSGNFVSSGPNGTIFAVPLRVTCRSARLSVSGRHPPLYRWRNLRTSTPLWLLSVSHSRSLTLGLWLLWLLSHPTRATGPSRRSLTLLSHPTRATRPSRRSLSLLSHPTRPLRQSLETISLAPITSHSSLETVPRDGLSLASLAPCKPSLPVQPSPGALVKNSL